MRKECLDLVLAVAALVWTAAFSHAQDTPVGRVIARIEPVNNKFRKNEYILAKMHMKVGQRYDEQTANADVARLIATGWFMPNGVELKTAIDKDTGDVTVFVLVSELMGTVKDITFIGNRHYSMDDLLDSIRVRRGDPMNPAANKVAAAAIAQKLRDDGRYYATCTLMQGDSPTDTAVVFHIVEGPIVRVGSVSFKGNQEASSGRLHTIINTRGALFGKPTILTSKYQPMSVRQDIEQLLLYYAKLGYLDARVEPEIIPTSKDLSTVEIVYHIHEGKPYNVRDVRYEGNRTYGEEKLKSITAIQPNERYDETVVRADAERITTLYGNSGHLVGVKREYYAVPNQPGLVDVHYKIMEPEGGFTRGPDKIGTIRIEGNTVTQDRVILNELGRLRPGYVLEYPEIKRAEANLARRNIFDMEDPPRIEVVPSPHGDNFKDLVVHVKETRTGMFGLQGGVNSNAGVSGTISLNQRNFDILRVPTSFDELISGNAFRGGGQEFRLQAMPGTVFQRYEATWREPYFLDSKYGLTTSAYYASRQFAEYNEHRYGGRVSVDYRFDNNRLWTASGSGRIEGVKINDVPWYASPAITNDIGSHFLMGARLGVTRDSRDSFLMPTTGSVIDIGYEHVFGDYTFPVGTAEATKFWTLHQARDGGWKGVLAARSQLSITDRNAPVFERFYGGGFRSIRGYTFRGVGPFENSLNVGGTFAFLNTLEYQIPLVANERLRFVTFVDHGTVDRNVSLDNYRVTVGVGLRIQIPAMGPLPIALDFGFPVTRKNDDVRQVFSFYVGWIGGQ